jgi:hypothetical protein
MKCTHVYEKQLSVISDVDENNPALFMHKVGRKITRINKRLSKLYSPM